jgi:5-methylcytosine-specific restriction protein A
MAKSKYANWYADRRWRAKRDAQLSKEPLCRYCAQLGRITPGYIADHIEPHRGDRAKFWNGELQTLCETCHSSTKQREENGFKSRLQRRNDSDSHWRR